MSTLVQVIPAVACAGLMGIPMAIGLIRGRLRRHRNTSPRQLARD
jgi:hypothetical protein